MVDQCIMQHVKKNGDQCGAVAVKGGNFCKSHTCIIQGCREKAIAYYPMLSSPYGEPRFCHKHHNEKYAGRYGVDFSGPDDFEIPC